MPDTLLNPAATFKAGKPRYVWSSFRIGSISVPPLAEFLVAALALGRNSTTGGKL